ncbi:hypothetical protein [Clostridium ihumii]|uniref:hypothetical protein n=1 Tax=Clostridium ihumii TaxID=1470356 RepID=UPI003D3386B6
MEFGTIGFTLNRIFESVILYFVISRTVKLLDKILIKIIKWIKKRKRKKYKKS